MKPGENKFTRGKAQEILMALSIQSPWPAPDKADGCAYFAEWYVAEAGDPKPREVVAFIDHCYKEAARGAEELWPVWWANISERQRWAVVAFVTRGMCDFLGLGPLYGLENSHRYGSKIQGGLSVTV